MATVGKKFTSPDKWDEAWFSKIRPDYKLLYLYLWDRCDHSGVIEFIPPLWSAHIGKEVDQEYFNKFLDKVNSNQERIAIFGDKVWLTQYIRFQQQPDRSKPIKVGHPMLPKIVKLLNDHKLYDEVKNRDPILFQAYETKNAVSNISKPTSSLTQGSGVSLSRSNSKSGSGSRSISHTTKTEELNIYEQVKDELGDLTLLNSGDLTFEKDMDELLKELTESDVKDPLNYLIGQTKNTDWMDTSWEEFKDSILAVGETPF